MKPKKQIRRPAKKGQTVAHHTHKKTDEEPEPTQKTVEERLAIIEKILLRYGMSAPPEEAEPKAEE